MFGTDVPGELPVGEGLREIRGISFSTSKAILNKTDIDNNKTIKELAEEDIEQIKDVINNSKLARNFLNRRKDPNEGKDEMLVSSDLEIQHKQDVDALKKLGSYRGLRHRQGLPVRGQKTKSSFRGDTSVGVSKSKIKQQQKE